MKKIAILSSGLDKRKTRGYENSSLNLFKLLSNYKSCDIYLIKGSGIKTTDNVIIINPFFKIIFEKIASKLFKNDYYGGEYFVFAIFFIFRSILLNTKFDYLYSKEPRVVLTLKRFRYLLPGNPKLVYGLGQMMPPKVFEGIGDIIHLVNIETYNDAIDEYRLKKNKFYLIPNSISSEKKYSGVLSKEQLRSKYNITTKKVIISIGAIDTKIKRMNYVINEVSNLSNDWTLILIGKVQEEEIISLGKKKLGKRFLQMHVVPEKISEFFKIADISVLASLREGFGNVVVESMMNGIPVMVHDRPLNRYIVEDEHLLVKMDIEGALVKKINNIDSLLYKKLSKKVLNRFNNIFSNHKILNLYLKLFDCD